MNKKYLYLGTALLLATGLAWMGRAMYRAKNNLVTLNVYNAPLASVIEQLERQTRETILAGKGLDAKVTLDVKNMPLDEVLDRLGPQVGANWSRWHAVHGSERALSKLEKALRNRTRIEEVGWTNLIAQETAMGGTWNASAGDMANASPDVLPPGAKTSVVVKRSKPMVIRLDSNDLKDGNAEATLREQLKAAGADESTIAQAGAAVRQATVDVDVQATGGGGDGGIKTGGHEPRIRMITRSRDGNGEVTEEIWSPEQVVLEERLRSKLGDTTYEDATEAVAREVAAKVNGSLTTLYVLRKSAGGFPFAGRMMRQIHSAAGDGTNAAHGELPPMPDIEGVVKRAEAENFTKLTPAQRVQRAREREAAKANP